mmetsp:Transcript_61069/g.164090  ORF Transcript_61069/g.164090 Transcript_61069/m.164090 type:complete len:95 (-) Transcript_61069:3-287(-)
MPADTATVALSFDAILNASGSPEAALIIAGLPFSPQQVTLAQAQAAFAKAIGLAGGFGAACTAAVPLLALPGVLLETVVGEEISLNIGGPYFKL